MAPLCRDLRALGSKDFDLVIVGGGIFGASATWEAAHRGLSVALIEQADFSGATSANHFKMVHGGIRYLAHGDIVRVRESSHERSALFRAVPHLAHPLPIVLPTYGHGKRGKGILRAGFLAYDLLTCDRNRGIRDPSRQIPNGSFLSRSRTLELFPDLDTHDLTGAAVLHDGQMYSPPRIALSFLRAATRAGAVVANYVRAEKLVVESGEARGVAARDLESDETITIRGKTVLNAAGPWAHRLVKSSLGIELRPTPTFSRDLAMVLPRRFTSKYALGCPIPSQDHDALLDRGGRHLFLVPWRDRTLVGVWHQVYRHSSDDIRVSETELQGFVDDANRAYAGLRLSLDEVQWIHTGLILFGDEESQGQDEISFAKRSILHDHAADGARGLWTLIGVRATVARGMAEKAIDQVFLHLGRSRVPSRSAVLPAFGGDFDDFESLVREAAADERVGDENVARALCHNYGTEFRRVLEHGDSARDANSPLPGTWVLPAEVRHAVREESALHLEDVVFRRTEIGSAGATPDATIEACAASVGQELGWSDDRRCREIERVRQTIATRGPWRFTPAPSTTLAAD